MVKRTPFIFSLLVAIFTLGYWLLTWSYDPTTRLVPLLIGTVTLCLAAIVLRNDFRSQPGGEEPEKEEDEEKIGQEGRSRNLVFLLCWLAAFFVLVVLVGFMISIPLAMVIFLRYYEAHSWRQILPATGVTWVVIYGLFEVLMGFQLFQGVLFGAILM